MTRAALLASLMLVGCDGTGTPATTGTGGLTGSDASATGSGGQDGQAEGGTSDGGVSADAGGDTAGTTTAPWPETCVPAAYLSRPAGAYLLTGPAGSQGFGEVALSGEAMTATLNGLVRSFNRFATSATGLVGYGFDGSIDISVPSLAPGTYSCPDAGFTYANLMAGARDSNSAGTGDCCMVQITRSGEIGELIEGTFSGILVHDPLQSWIKVEAGHFTVVRRDGAGGIGGAGQGGMGGGGQGGADGGV